MYLFATNLEAVVARSHGDELRVNLSRLLKSNDKRTIGLLEKKSGVDRSVISRILSYETKNPHLKTVVKLEKAINEINNSTSDRQKVQLIDETVRGALENITSNDKEIERVHLDENEKLAITKNSFTSFLYGLISSQSSNKIYREDILKKFGQHKKNDLDDLIKSGVLIESDPSGEIKTRIKNITIEDSHFLLKMAISDLEYFDQDSIGVAAALARRNGTTSKEGIEKIRRVVYDALIKIAEIPNKHEGNISFHTNLFANVYDFNEYLRSED